MRQGPPPAPAGLGRIAALALLALTAAACLTVDQTRSIEAHVERIRRQAEEVRRQQQGNSRALEALSVGTGESDAPAGRPAAAGPPGAPAPGGPTAPDRDPPPSPPGDPDAVPVLPPLETAAPPATAPPAYPPAASVAALYRDGYALYHRRDYAAAERRLREFLAADPRGPLADNAHYWIGESRFARGLYRDAIGEFRVVLERFRSGDKAAHALYKIALCHDRLGEVASMRRSLDAVVRDFPQSDVASLARARLARPVR